MKPLLTLSLLVLLPLSSFANSNTSANIKSSRKIQQEDLGAAKTKAVAYSAPAAYTAAVPMNPPSTPGIGFPAPPANASPDAMAQAIQSFMNYLTGVDEQGNPQGFPDWTDPKIINNQQSAPGLPLITGTALDASCDGLSEDAKLRMKNYLQGCGGVLQNQTGKVAITDFSTSTPTLYVLNSKDLSCAGSTRVTYGVGSHGNPPVAGNEGGSSQTPAGFLVTKPHHGRLYQEWNSIGIQGMGSENGKTIGRGVILHPSNGHTLGCVGIPPSRFVTVKRALAYGSVVLNYFPGQMGSSQRRCPNYGNKRNTSSDGVNGVQ